MAQTEYCVSGAETNRGEDDVEAAKVVDKDEGCDWAEIGSKDGVNGDVTTNVGAAGDARMRDGMVVWLCPLEVTSEVSFAASSGVTTGSFCNNGWNFDCIPDQKESYVRDAGLKLFVVEVSLLI